MARTYSDASGLPNWLAVALGAIFCLLVLYYSRKILMEIFGEWRNGICSLGEMATISKSETPGLFFVAATFKTVITIAILAFIGYVVFVGIIVALGHLF